MKSSNAGYSLLEVLVAFAIMAMVLAALIPGQAKLFGRTVSADETFLATDYALSRLDRLGTSDEIQVGLVEETYRDWRIILVISNEPFESMENGALRIKLRVETLGSQFLAEVESLRLP